ncbi:MAG TPA: hypothetical protein VG103_09350 [Chthoniobacterales bacterium]|jgi:hypothetical protein|nr:hypothetical protein [Chthoniobacterales bacterium]
MKPMIRIRGKYVNANQIDSHEKPRFEDREELVCKPGRDIREVIGRKISREMVLSVTIQGQPNVLRGQYATEAWEDLQG